MTPQKISFFNTLKAKKELFVPANAGVANIYSCGPTVYSFTHVGNARAAITADFVVRVFKLAGYQTRFATNITDVDDKIIKAANENSKSAAEIAKEFEEHYLDELQKLSVLAPDARPRATEHIPQMVKMIETLIEKGNAYSAKTPFGHDVYFRVLSFKQYGKLSNRDPDDLLIGARIEPGEMKENPLDFALWKAAKPGEPAWDSPWGQGRPGWHIECSAMVAEHFPNGIDIHMGGLDLIFPHHENEIAQSECCQEKVFAPYWIHNGMLTIEREKMSKSLGNVFLTRDFLNRFGPETLRLLMLQHHYRSPIDFSEESIHRSEALLERIYLGIEKAQQHRNPQEKTQLESQMQEALFDDFNSAKAIGFFLKTLRQAFKENQESIWQELNSGIVLLKSVYGLCEKNPQEAMKSIQNLRYQRSGKDNDYCASVELRLLKRQELRNAKEFQAADDLRKELESEGVIVMDGPDGTSWRL